MRTRATLKVLVWTVALLASANNLAGWGGVALTPGIGYAAQERSIYGAPLVWTYLNLGEAACSVLGQDARAVALAQGRFGAAYPATRLEPDRTVDLLFEGMGGLQRLLHYAAPLLILLGLVLHATGPKPVHLMRGR